MDSKSEDDVADEFVFCVYGDVSEDREEISYVHRETVLMTYTSRRFES